jgi:Glycosyltransferase family 9 (heptosyltransferase)
MAVRAAGLDVVALRAAGVGDLLTAVPALRAVATLGHDGVTLAAPSWLHPLAPLIPGVTGAVDVDGLTPKVSLSGRVAINLHGQGPQSHTGLLERGPRDLVAFYCPSVWEFGPPWFTDDVDEPERERFCRLLEWVGVTADPLAIGLRIPGVEAPVTDAVVLHVGGTDPRRRWPAEKFAELARGLQGEPLVVTGGPGDLVTAHRVARMAGLDPSVVLAGRLALDEFAAVIAHARLVVTGDTGAAHLAHAYGRPSVVIFGPASPGQWGPPPGVPSTVLRAAGPSPSAADVAVAEVREAVRERLGDS